MTNITTQRFTAAEIKKLAGELKSLDDRITKLNEAKAAIFRTTKAQYGCSVFYGLKLAIQLLRSDPRTRAQKLAGNAYAEEIIKILLSEESQTPDHANSNTPPQTMNVTQQAPPPVVTATVVTAPANPLVVAHATDEPEQLVAATGESILTYDDVPPCSSTDEPPAAEANSASVADAISALVNLKFTRARAVVAVNAVLSESGLQPTEELIRLALQEVGRSPKPLRLPVAEPLVTLSEEFDEVIEQTDEVSEWGASDIAA